MYIRPVQFTMWRKSQQSQWQALAHADVETASGGVIPGSQDGTCFIGWFSVFQCGVCSALSGRVMLVICSGLVSNPWGSWWKTKKTHSMRHKWDTCQAVLGWPSARCWILRVGDAEIPRKWYHHKISCGKSQANTLVYPIEMELFRFLCHVSSRVYACLVGALEHCFHILIYWE